MNVTIDKHNFSERLVKKLCTLIGRLLIMNTDRNKLSYLEEYVNTNDLFGIGKSISLCQVILLVSKNIVYISDKYSYHIMLDKKALLPNTKLKLIDIMMFIDYGNLEVDGLYLLGSIFNDIRQDQDKYKKLIKEGVVMG